MAIKAPNLFPIFIFLMLYCTGNLFGATLPFASEQFPQEEANSTTLYASNAVISITANSFIFLTGDLQVHNSRILGHGKVVMESQQEQKIKSISSTISNLEINNPTTVKLIGSLVIEESLTIKKCLLDLSEGELNVNTENLALLEGATIFSGNQAFWSTPPVGSFVSNPYQQALIFQEIPFLYTTNRLFYKKSLPAFKEMLHGAEHANIFFHPPLQA